MRTLKRFIRFLMQKVLFRILHAIGFTRFLRELLEDEKKKRCFQRSVTDIGVQFGPDAVVHNHRGPEAVQIGAHTHIDGEILTHDYGGSVEIGSFCYIGQGSRIWSGERVRIGHHVFLAHNVNVTDTNSHQFDAVERAEHFRNRVVEGRPFEKGTIETAPIVIEDHVWINFNVGILKGVHIGEGAVVGACSLVTKDVPAYTLVAGSPARILRKLSKKEST